MGEGYVKNSEKSADVLYGRPLPFARSCVWKSAKGSIGCCLHYYTTTKTHIWECRVLNIWFLSPFVPSKILICLRAIYVYFYKRKYFVKVNIDGSVLKKYTNWDKLSCLSLYIFLSFWGNERRQKPNIPHLKLYVGQRTPMQQIEFYLELWLSSFGHGWNLLLKLLYPFPEWLKFVHL